jgi:hypothetical protein
VIRKDAPTVVIRVYRFGIVRVEISADGRWVKIDPEGWKDRYSRSVIVYLLTREHCRASPVNIIDDIWNGVFQDRRAKDVVYHTDAELKKGKEGSRNGISARSNIH